MEIHVRSSLPASCARSVPGGAPVTLQGINQAVIQRNPDALRAGGASSRNEKLHPEAPPLHLGLADAADALSELTVASEYEHPQ